jgi:predicted oxidoreductase
MNPRPIALGCMRLSTEPDRNDDRSIAVLHAAFDAGVTLLDTADAYCWDESERGHNERLIARTISTWPRRAPMDPDTNAGTATTARSFPGRNFCERARPQVATKGGLADR